MIRRFPGERLAPLGEVFHLPIELGQVLGQGLEEFPKRAGQAIFGILQNLGNAPLQGRQTFGHDQAEFGEESADLIALSRPGNDEALASPMQGQEHLLFRVLHRHAAHRRPGHGLANRLGIGGVVLVGFDVGLDELRCHEFYRVAQSRQTPRPIMGTAAGLDADEAGRPVRKERQDLMALEGFADDRLASFVDGMQLDDLFGDIEAGGGNGHGSLHSRRTR